MPAIKIAADILNLKLKIIDKLGLYFTPEILIKQQRDMLLKMCFENSFKYVLYV